MRRLSRGEWAAALAVALASILSAVAWAVPDLGPFARGHPLDLTWVLLALAAGAAALAASLRPENAATRRSMQLLAATAAATAFAWTGLAWHDLTHVASLALLAAALAAWPRTRTRMSAGDVVDGTLVVGAVLVAALAFVAVPILEGGLARSELLHSAFPVGAALLVAAALAGLALGRLEDHGRLGVVTVGLVGLVLADRNLAVVADYSPGSSLLDLGWTVGLALLGLAVLLPPGWAPRLATPSAVGPVVALALLAVVGDGQIIAATRQKDLPHAAVTVTALLFLALLGLRYAASAGTRVRLQEQLRSEHAVREGALEASRTGMCVFDVEGSPVYRNAAWARLLGSDAESGAPWLDVAGGLVGCLAPPGACDEQPVPLRFWTAEGRYVEVGTTRLSTGQLLMSVDDLTDEERERVTRSRFLAEMVGAQDHEARRMAELLHDDVVQRLTAMGLRLELHAGRTGDEALRELVAESSAVTAAIRRLLVDLHPVVLESRGLGAAIDAEAAELRALGTQVRVAPFEPRLAPADEQLAYRLLQEALANTLQHASADHVEVSLRLDGRRLHAVVSDDGCGLDQEGIATAVSRGSLGLRLARERLELAGGRLRVERREGGGTVFAFELPLRDPAPEHEPGRPLQEVGT